MTETNRRYWDALAAVHGQDRLYDTDALVAGASTLHDTEEAALREAVGDVAGLEVVHLQCHIGHDTISLARRGARVSGVDRSPASLAKARATADEGPPRFDDDGSYADPDARPATTASVQHGHALGEILTAAVRAGLCVDALHEHLDAAFDPRGDLLARDADGRCRLRLGGGELPVLYALIATRP